MDANEVSKLVEDVSNWVLENTGEPLDIVDKSLLGQALEGKKLKDIQYGTYTTGSIQNRASKLWKKLQSVTGKEIHIRNVQAELKDFQKQKSHSEEAAELPFPAETQAELNGHAAFNDSWSCPELGNGKTPSEQPNSHCSNGQNPNYLSSAEECGTLLFNNGHLHESSEANNSESLEVEDYSPDSAAEEFPLSSQASQPDNDEPNFGNRSFGWHDFIKFIKPGVPLLLTVGILGSGFAMSWLFNWYGVKNHLAGNLFKAQHFYFWAGKIYPFSTASQYNQGASYEDFGKDNYKKAHYEYNQACLGGSIQACNNNARLYNLEKDYGTAVDLLNKFLPQAKDNDEKHTILKNLGWARKGQGRLDEAKRDLEKAIQLNKREAVPHCLLAQVLEGKNDKKGALEQWRLCNDYAYLPKFPEEDELFHLAKQRLDAEGSEK